MTNHAEHPEHTAPHVAADGETFTPTPASPLRLEVVIDNQDAQEEGAQEWPYTMSAYLTEPNGAPLPVATGLIIGNGDATVGKSIPEMLRNLADLIEAGEVFA